MNQFTFKKGVREFVQYTVDDLNELVRQNQITASERNQIIFEACYETKMKEIAEACDSELDALVANYSKMEVATFDKQESEARAWQADNNAATPLLDLLVEERQKSKQAVAERILEKAEKFVLASGRIIGKRQRLEDKLEALLNVNDPTPGDIGLIEAISW